MSFCWMIIVPHSRLVGTDRTTLANTCMVILLLLVADSSQTVLRALTICENWTTRSASSQMERVSSPEQRTANGQDDPALEG